jgi:hypothetical protein
MSHIEEDAARSVRLQEVNDVDVRFRVKKVNEIRLVILEFVKDTSEKRLILVSTDFMNNPTGG